MLTDSGQQIDVNRKLITYYSFLIRLSRRKVSEFWTNMESLREIWLPDKGEEHHYDCHTRKNQVLCSVPSQLLAKEINHNEDLCLIILQSLLDRNAHLPVGKYAYVARVLWDENPVG